MRINVLVSVSLSAGIPTPAIRGRFDHLRAAHVARLPAAVPLAHAEDVGGELGGEGSKICIRLSSGYLPVLVSHFY